MCRIGIKDSINLIPATGRRYIDCDSSEVPIDDSNLAIKALDAFSSAACIDEGADIYLEKVIPAGAGLGGGSSNAAAVLTGLNDFYGKPLSESQLIEAGLEVGADVPFFIKGEPSVVTGIGEKIEKINKIKHYHLLVLWPGEMLSTGEVYKNFNLGLTNCKKKTKSRLLNAGLLDPLDFLYNDLEDPAGKMTDSIGKMRKLLEVSGSEGTLMSGSGSAVFGLFNSAEKAKKAGCTIGKIIGGQREYSRYKLFVTQMIL